MDISVIILTKDEEIHIRRCLEKLQPLQPKQVFIVDCFSTDRTAEIAKELGATVVEHPWPGTQAVQFNWALDHLPIASDWILRLDADEYLFPETIEEVKGLLPTLSDDVTSLSLPLARTWMNRVVRRGVGQVVLRRFFRYGKGRCEERLMDEHIATTEGRDLMLKGAFIDHNLRDLSWWARKHIGYAEREAIDLLNIEYCLFETEEKCLNEQTAAKRAKKIKYAHLPLFWRSFAYFCMRYFLRGGFLEGKEGFLWHFMQGWWYRTLVDAKVLEFKRKAGVTGRMADEEARGRIFDLLASNPVFRSFTESSRLSAT